MSLKPNGPDQEELLNEAMSLFAGSQEKPRTAETNQRSDSSVHQHRAHLAQKINIALLKSQGQAPESDLDRLQRHYHALMDLPKTASIRGASWLSLDPIPYTTQNTIDESLMASAVASTLQIAPHREHLQDPAEANTNMEVDAD